MAAITPEVIRQLAGFKGTAAPVITCYLDVDGRRHIRRRDYEHQLDSLLRRARAQENGTKSVRRDIRRIEEYVKQGLDRSRTRGLAIFACSAHDLFEVVPLPFPVRNQVVVNHTPAVGQLESVVQERPRFGVLLADRQRARIFVFELGELVERSEVVDKLPRDYDQRGEKERGDVAHHVDELANQHLRHAARAAFHLYQEHPFDLLSLGGPDELVGQLEAVLHPYLKERLCERIGVPVGASLDEVVHAAADVEIRQERRREAQLVAQLREAAGGGRRGVTGLAGVLAALGQRRVENLLVSEGFQESGKACRPCGLLAVREAACPACQGSMEHVEDVVEEAVEQALGQSCHVEICVDNADLDVLGRVGALLRF